MDRLRLFEKVVAEAVEPSTEETDTQPDSEFDIGRGRNAVKSENASNLSMTHRSGSHSKPGRAGLSLSHPEMPPRGKFIIVPEADMEDDFVIHSLRKEKDFESFDNYQPRYFDNPFRDNRSHNFKIPVTDNSPRDHPLYQKATAGADGLYHCPWEKDGSCNHKPEKLKCNYDKCVDSHLKPYRCKATECENGRFSSTACLLRHEREAHSMHGHGEKPFLCTLDGCERGVPGNGFPRHWNLCDHMKRVHNRSLTPPSRTIRPPKGSKKRKSSTDPLVTNSGSVEKARIPVRSLSLSEQFQHGQQQLLSEMMEIPDVGDVENMINKIEKASNLLKLMARATQELNSMPRNLHGREKSADDISIGGESTTPRLEMEGKAQNRYQAIVEDDDK